MPAIHLDAVRIGRELVAHVFTIAAEDDFTILALASVQVARQAPAALVRQVWRRGFVTAVVPAPVVTL